MSSAMPNIIRHPDDLECAPEEDIVATASRLLAHSMFAYHEDSSLAGVVYYAYETPEWRCIDLAACRRLVALYLDGESDAYERWCPELKPTSSGPTRPTTLAAAGWST